MMSANKLIIAVLSLLAASLLIILSELYLWENYEAAEIKEFQRYVCGFGLGATINPAWGFISYDQRVDHVDETQLWPVPGGYSYSPDRGLSVSDFKEVIFNDL